MVTKNKKIISALSLSAILAFLAWVVSQTVGLGAGGFDTTSVLTQYTFYQSGGIFLGIVLMFFFIELLTKKGDAEYGDSICYASPGENPSLSIFKRLNQIQITLISLIIFSILGFIAVNTNQKTFTGLRVLEHQFTPVASMLYSSLLIPISENMGSAAVIAFSLFSLRVMARKGNWNKASFVLLTWVFIPLIVGLYGLTNHLLRYGDQSTALVVVFIFWTTGGFITILTGSFIPFLTMHLMNNLFFDMRRLFSSEIFKSYIIIGIISLIVISVILWYFFWRKNNNNIYI